MWDALLSRWMKSWRPLTFSIAELRDSAPAFQRHRVSVSHSFQVLVSRNYTTYQSSAVQLGIDLMASAFPTGYITISNDTRMSTVLI